MNYADARRVASRLEGLGFQSTPRSEDADVIVLETCSVRQQSEDKAYNKLHNLKPLKDRRPDLTVAVMGCVVGVRGNQRLKERFPFIDVFMEPSTDGDPLVSYLFQDEELSDEQERDSLRHAVQDGEVILPVDQRGELVSAPVSIVYGCSHACTFCIIPHKRGKERSRPVGVVAAEVRSLVEQGVKEVVLLGQIVDRYGYDVPDGPDLADLLNVLHGTEGLERIRFLTSHPTYMTNKILRTVADLPKVMPHIEVPIQAGDDEVLKRMRREYTSTDYRRLVNRIREIVPDVAINTDIIVGFPGETEAQFQNTLDILTELELDKIHLARYSPRPGTVSARRMIDDVPDEVKRRRFQEVEALNRDISERKMRRWLGQTVEVLVEGHHKDRWKGRTPQNKLVFFNDPHHLKGYVVPIRVTHAGPWSLSGETSGRPTGRPLVAEAVDSIRLTVLR
jgi:tRNA-2-methylthio-N6-dimethylallyladenosine synthase